MPPDYFPLRWESTGDQWWYASPIDWAAANGHYDLVRELLHLDTNLLIKLTSLRRIRRLETVWDDEEQFEDVAKCRSHIAQKLLLECETNKGHNSLIRAGYGGWLLYTAASAGDLSFVRKLLERDPFLVFGEGEYGVTDLFYAAARSKNSEVFRVLLGFSISPGTFGCNNGELEDQLKEIPSNFKWEMMNRAVHAAAGGGNLELLKELIGGDCSDVLGYRDLQGSTILHTAAGRGRVEVVKDILVFYDIITTTDNQGNTALHVAAYRGYLAVVELLVLESPSVSSLTNNCGDTFLHMAVAGFRTPGFRRVDRQIELMKKLVSGKIMIMEDIINVRNNDGRTALHMAVIENIQSDMVELLMTVRSINLNIRDSDGLTPLDLLKQRPQSASSEILIKRLISAGGISNCHDRVARTALVSHLKTNGIGSSPGTSFRIPDAEIFLYTGIDASDASHDQGSVEFSTCSSELSRFGSASEYNSLDKKKMISVNHAARRLKILLRWTRKKERKSNSPKSEYNDDDEDSIESYKISSDWEENPIPLRQRYSKLSYLPNNKRTFSIRSDLPSPSMKRKFAAGLMHGVIRAVPPQVSILTGSPSSPFSGSSMSSPSSIHQEKSSGNSKMNRKSPSFNKRLMNQYFCFGAQGIAVEDSNSCTVPNQRYKHSINSLTA